MKIEKPQIFIASSVEGLDIAYEIQGLLERDAECTVWDQDVFSPSSYTLQDLVEKAGNSDYGIFVFSLDDTTKMRGAEKKTVRDNVILEMGLFVGTIGYKNCFIILPRDIEGFHLPTDLTGITPLTYDTNRKDGNIKAALGPPTNQIKKAIKKFTTIDRQLADCFKQQINTVGLNAFYSSRDDYNKYRKDAASIDKYIDTAQKSIFMVSISLMTGIPFDDICAIIRKRLCEQEDFTVTISLLNPLQDELFMTLQPMFSLELEALKDRTKEALRELNNLKNGLDPKQQKRFTLRVHRTLPFGSAIILDGDCDNGKIQIETKPYKVGMRRSFAFEVINNGGIFYDTLKTSYYELVEDGLDYDELGL